MELDRDQLVKLRDHIAANPAVQGLPHTSDNADIVAATYNQMAVPPFWVWRLGLPTQEIYDVTTAEGTFWDWDIFEGITTSKRETWVEMNRSSQLNMSLTNVRNELGRIFVTAAQRPNQTHVLTAGRRQAQLGEQLYAVGPGSTASPATMGEVGNITRQNVEDAWAQP